MALKGTLKDFGIADIFQLIGQQQKTGILHLTDRDQEVHVVFKDGTVVRTESATRKKKELLGDMLTRAGLITERQLAEALEEQKRTLRRLGDVLTGAGIISNDALKQMAHLQTTETLYRLFAWKSGRYEFEAVDVDYDAEAVTPIRSESVLMEAFRRVDEWPIIRKRIHHNGLTFERLAPLPPERAKAGDEFDGAFDAALGGESGPADEEDGFVGPNERRIFRLAEPGRDVQYLVDRSRLGEFEACKSLLNLVLGGYLQSLEGVGIDDSAAGRTAPGWWASRTAQLAVALLTAGVASLWVVALRSDAGERPANPAIARHVGKAQLARIEAAIGAFTLQKGHCPDTLQEVVELGMLSDSDLRYPWREPYHYRRTGPSSYVLLPPIK